MSEKAIENSILNWLGWKGIYAWKVQSVGVYDQAKKTFRTPGRLYRRGVSDILGILPDGRLLSIEVKSATGRLSEHQKIFLDEITSRRGLAFVARSIEDVEDKLKSYMGE